MRLTKSIKNSIKEYWRVFRANIYDGKRMEENMRSMRSALLLLACFSLVIALFNVLGQQYRMMVSSIVLFVLFISTYIVTKLTDKNAPSIVVCMLGIVVVFTYYVFSGGNEGFSILWTLLAPMFMMIIIGVKAGVTVGAYFQILLIVLFWTPLRSLVEMHYTEEFLKRFPVLYLCTLVTSLVAMLSHKKQQMDLDAYQEKLERAVQEEHDKAKTIAFQTVGAIIGLVDAKDAYTDDHSLRVAHYSLLLAGEMGWDQKATETLYYSALLHDIGKVGIHDAILKKTGNLNGNEYEIMKTHTSIGATILREMSFLEDIDEGALYHHEKYDGTGYPFGLKGEDIPKSARIICVADSFDAMNTARVYRAKCDKEYILNELRNGSGKQFDPEVVDAFFRCLNKNTISMDVL